MVSKYEHMKFSQMPNKINWYYAPAFVAFWFLVFFLIVNTTYYSMPKTLTQEDAVNHPHEFIGERSEQNLLALTQIGVRMVGSANNEQAAISFFRRTINKIIEESRTDLYDIEMDVQVASGNYFIFGMVNMYQAIQNVVVKFSAKNSKSNSYLLMNSHFDSVAGSSGAGDDGVMVSIMLEVLRVLSQSPDPLEHPIVFLFNGAEENPLQGSHAFITQHKWAKNCRAVINLDSAGSGGREVLFQSGPNHPWLMKYYRKHIVHPYGSTIGEEMFQNNFIPSDTDFRVFRDYGNLPGLDMAHFMNGYVYHTKYDKFNVVQRGSHQSTGENVLALARGLGNAPELENPTKHAVGHTVYYDFLGLVLVFYSETTSIVINCIVSVGIFIAIGVSVWLTKKHTGLSVKTVFTQFGLIFAIQLVSIFAGLCVPMVLGMFMDAVGLPLSWYYHNWLLVGLYVCPSVFCLGIIPAVFMQMTKRKGLPLANKVRMLMHSQAIVIAIATIALTALNIRSGFALMISNFFYLCSLILILATCTYKTSLLWFVIHVIAEITPYIFYTYNMQTFYVTFIPMQGRDGPDGNPEFLISAFTALLTVVIGGFLVPLLHMFRKSKTVISCFGVVTIVFIIIAATPVGFPYAEKLAPQRFYTLHATRTFHGMDRSVSRTDSGFFVMPVDRRPNSIKPYIKNGSEAQLFNEDCSQEIMCGQPLYSARWLGWKNASFWIPASAPNLIRKPTFKLISLKAEGNKVRVEAEVKGPDHMSFFIRPLQENVLLDWSFDRTPIEKGYKPPYFVYYSYATDPTPVQFFLEFERNSPEGPIFDLAVIGHLTHHDSYFTEDYKEFLASYPKWADTAAWTSSYESFIF